MRLGKRASVLILPVILVSYALAAIIVYQQQSLSLSSLEQSRLELRVSKLRSEFNLYDSFVDAYILSLLESEALSGFIREPDNIYRGKVLSANLESSISRYFGNSNELASLAIMDQQNNLVFFLENSTDPFSAASPEQLHLSAQMRAQNLLFKWEHLQATDNSIIQQGVSIDARTFAPPLITDMRNTFKVIASIRPLSFDQQLQQIREDYNAVVHFSDAPTTTKMAAEHLTASTQLKSNYFLTLTPDSDYISGKLAGLKQKLALLFSTSSLVTIMLIQLLLRRFITGPIEQLDQQLTEVMEERRKNIDVHEQNDEVSRLGKKFYLLHDQLNNTLQETHAQSRTDALTQLPNRTAFYENTSKLLSLSEQKQAFSLIYLDLDNFKFVNDKYGHEVGDQLLKAVATRLNHTVTFFTQKRFEQEGQIYRLSGDEFIITLPTADHGFIRNLGQKILYAFADGYHFELGHFPVTASLGVATCPKDGHTLSQLISNADLAMYQAKKSGKNKLAFYSQELAKKDRNAKEIESRLKEIDYNREFSLNYMPVIDKKGAIKGCEALLRWHSPSLGFVSPALFIPIAESTGVFEKIDLWVIEHVFMDMPVLKALLGQDAEISINVSSAELNSERFYNELIALQEKHQIDSHTIILEITETFALDQERNALEWLQALRKPGYKIAIDDFGNGYTSLMQMVDYPVDIIKFDRQLVERIAQPEKQELAKALVDLCHLQGMCVVAEGVETLEQSELLKQVKCNFQQGYLIAKPMPLSDLSDWLQQRKKEGIQDKH